MGNVTLAELRRLDAALAACEKARNAALRSFRLNCEHLHLAERDSDSPPHRLCVDCGAVEQGWHCGYQVLVLASETTRKAPLRGIVRRSFEWHEPVLAYWPRYFVGQSHRNFAGGGRKTYEQLTEIPE